MTCTYSVTTYINIHKNILFLSLIVYVFIDSWFFNTNVFSLKHMEFNGNVNSELKIRKGMVGSIRSLIEVQFRKLSGASGVRTREESVSILGILAEIRAEHL
jgi:hypothetical protein